MHMYEGRILLYAVCWKTKILLAFKITNFSNERHFGKGFYLYNFFFGAIIIFMFLVELVTQLFNS